jgi:ribosomal-protein-serine acetyltransferase
MQLREDIGDGVSLRPLCDADIDELHAAIAANRAHLRPWMPWADQGAEATAGFVRAAVGDAERREALHLAIVANGAIVGVCGFVAISWARRSANVGYWLAEASQGRGIVTRAVRTLLDHAFTTFDLHRIEVRAATDNVRSRAVVERLGFTHEGVLREAEHVGDRFVDSAVYSMLAWEWPRRAR